MDVHFVRKFPSVAEGRAANSIYLEGTPDKDHFTIYVTTSNPVVFRSTISKEYVDEQLASLGVRGQVRYVTNISERNILVLETDTLVLVEDASDDPQLVSTSPTTSKDGMAYMFIKDTNSFKALFRLTKSPYAEGAPHLHANKAVLDRLGTTTVTAADGSTIEQITLGGVRIPSIVVDNPVW